MLMFKKIIAQCCFSLVCFAGIGYANPPAAPTKAEAAVTAKKTIQQIFALADVQINGTRPWDIKVHNDKFYRRVLSQGSLGLGESYMDGWWDSDDLEECIYKIQRADLTSKVKPSWKMYWECTKAYLFNLQDKLGSKKVIKEHYQLGNDLYTEMLDPLMAYSCGYWKEAKNLTEAQEAKLDLICKKLQLKPGMKVLDIGCGWGGFAKFAAERYGVEMVGITLSENQAELAREMCKGLPVEIRIQDYRDVKGSFDRVLEIGMFEHVGSKNYRTFMEVAHRVLKPGGLFMLHTIGRNNSALVTDPWIDKYIFPHGQLPSIAQIGHSIENLFVMEDWHNFGPDYEKTLVAWFANFDKSWEKIKPDYSNRFYRMWKYYLLSCAGSFKARDLQLWQVVLSKGGVEGGYQCVR